ncbi:2-oxoglutarate (2OG) and Fe(II)-dependent oxygenase superfamily protein [Melia azedarach]|uniref:2-oxoglutarate (2OG) and Fe(II)-dependent oxygenase superfamily protein n=1 Tax=Melia azedarach TaxID=155640 RepID=A0ACC1XB86_MELAZ|nr:2-oxoglutarate (2OG) and Fe(II)-dependent oxygenase superfamily protein [Melia azedarach]
MENSNHQSKNGAEAHTASNKVSVLNCIDLSSPDIHQSVSLLKQACLDCGFFYVINHGISQEFMDEVFAQSKRFFSLPLNEKMKLLRNEKHRGYTPLLDELLDPDNQVHGDYKEGYYIGVEVPEGDLESDKPFYGPNVWPAADVLPGWKETMERFHREALEVAKAIARIIALALDLEIDFFERPEMLGEPISILRLLHYEGRISDPLKGLYGAGAHSDYGLITLLATDDVMGLQICKDKDAKPQIWEYVPPLKGGFIVNLGDMLERWSNCIFKSTLHRVLVNGQERYSIAYFVEPSHDCLVECLPTCKSEQNPARFPPIKCTTYLSQRYRDTHADLNLYKKHQT